MIKKYRAIVLAVVLLLSIGCVVSQNGLPMQNPSDIVALKSKALSDLKQPITDKKYDTALALWDQITAQPVDPGIIVQNPPISLDYSQYVTLTGNQDGWGGCGGRTQIHCMNIIKEMEHPYTPDLSFWYMDARQKELLESGIQDDVLTKTLVEKYGICTEASFPSDYDNKVAYDSQGNAYTDYNAMPQINDAINKEAALYKVKTFSDSKQPSVQNIKSLLVKYGPVYADGAMPFITGNYVDQISGTISSDGKVQFTRDRPGEWTQVYTGSVSTYPDKLYMEGTFTHTGAQGNFPWSATLEGTFGQTQSTPSDISGKWLMLGGEHGDDFTFDLVLIQQGSQLSGTMTCISCEGHCVTIVGYNDDLQAFKILNSWGDTWNGNGYIYLPYDKVAENLGAVKYFENLFSDRSSTEYAYTARINVTAPQRNQLVVKVGAERKEAKTVWDTPNQIECIDNSITLCIDVPLPSYASQTWPPYQNQWYAEITNQGPGLAKVNEVTMARRISDPSCLSVGKFRTETYGAQSLPMVDPGKTVKVYVKGKAKSPITAAIKESFGLKFEPAKVELPGGDFKAVFSGSLTVTTLAGSQPAENRKITIYKKSQPSCLNLHPKWIIVGSVLTGPNGGFTFEPPDVGGVYAAAILDSSGNVLASSAEAFLPTRIREISLQIPKEMLELNVPENPMQDLGQPEILPAIRDAIRTDSMPGRERQNLLASNP